MIKSITAAAAVLTAGLGLGAGAAQAQEPFVGEIRVFGSNFCPRGWADADGQLLPISQNSALFSLYGTMYGGDGRTTFGLPDLRGRAILHEGNGPGREPAVQGQPGGNVQVLEPRANQVGTRELEPTTPTLTIRYCVALVGIYPSRS